MVRLSMYLHQVRSGREAFCSGRSTRIWPGHRELPRSGPVALPSTHSPAKRARDRALRDARGPVSFTVRGGPGIERVRRYTLQVWCTHHKVVPAGPTLSKAISGRSSAVRSPRRSAALPASDTRCPFGSRPTMATAAAREGTDADRARFDQTVDLDEARAAARSPKRYVGYRAPTRRTTATRADSGDQQASPPKTMHWSGHLCTPACATTALDCCVEVVPGIRGRRSPPGLCCYPGNIDASDDAASSAPHPATPSSSPR